MARPFSAALHDAPELPAELVEQLRLVLKGLRYGTIELTVHEGVVVQIERREKVRISLKNGVSDH